MARLNFATTLIKGLLAAALATVALSASAQAPLEDLLNPQRGGASSSEQKVSSFRYDALRDAALSLGARSGLNWRAGGIVADLELRASKLDAMYRFSALVTPQGVMPPVIVEARDAVTVQPEVMRIADRIYRIEVKARFVSTPPTWREYLLVGLRQDLKAEMPHPSLLPKNADELVVWRKFVTDGWNEGVRQAEQILELNMVRLERDYLGMLRFSALLARGLVSEPKVGADIAVVTGGGREMTVGDSVYRVTQQSGLIPDASKWKPAISGAKR